MKRPHLQAVDAEQVNPSVPAGSDDGSGGSGIETRLKALETRVEYLATKEDVAEIKGPLEFFATKEDMQKVKVWVLSGVLGGMVLVATLVIGIAKFFF